MNVLFSLFVFVVANYLRINDISNNYKGVWDIPFSLLFTNFAKSKKGEAMEKENIMTVDIEDFKKSQHILDYIDDDFAIVRGRDVPSQFAGGVPYLFFKANIGVIFFSHCSCGCTEESLRRMTERVKIQGRGMKTGWTGRLRGCSSSIGFYP